MNLEQAAEQVLRGAFLDCRRCDGTGYYTTMQVHVHDELDMKTCTVCEGKGRKYRTNYLTACRVLGMEPVPIPRWKDAILYHPTQEISLVSAVANFQNWSKKQEP